MGTAVARISRPRAWSGYLALGLVATAAVLSTRGATAELATNAVQLGAAATGFVAVHRHEPDTATPWRLIALGFTLATLGDITWVLAGPLHTRPPFYVLIGLLFMSKQALLACGLIRMVPRDAARSRLDATIDGMILAAGAAVGLWTFVGQAMVYTGPLGGVGTTTALTYIVLDLAVLAALGRLLFVSGVPGPPAVLLICSVAGLLVADGAYCVGLGQGNLDTTPPVSVVGWLVCSVLFGAAALHPGAREVCRPHQAGQGTAAARVVAFTVFAVVDPVIGAVVNALSRHHVSPLDSLVPALLLMVLSLLLVLRLVLLLRTSNARAAALREALHAQEDLQAQLTFRALHDPLTGLGNRALLAERLTAAVRGRFALLMLDLDGFKDINDTLGHPAGDELLVEVAARLRAVVGDPDPTGPVAVRLGGDEFAILLPGAERGPATRVAGAVLAAIRAPYLVAGRQLYLTTSIGVLAADHPRRAPGDAMRDTDIALYAAKSAGKNQVVVFDAALRRVRGERARLATGLRRALADDALHLHYQPIVDLASGAVHAVEALLRWYPPGGRPVSPTEFVPVAEETGLMVPIGSWVLDRALHQARDWYERYGVAVSVNVSALQFASGDFAGTVLDALDRAGMPGAGLILELTESVLIDQGNDAGHAVSAQLSRLREHGVRVAVDDFGTGYSSLSYLWQLPVDVLKIDRAFTGGLSGREQQERRAAFLQAILDVGRSLQLQTVAEGVESPEEARRLRGMGCRYVQGYLFAAPLPAGAMAEYLARPVAVRSG